MKTCWFLFSWLQNSILWWPGPHRVTIPGTTQSSIATILETSRDWQDPANIFETFWTIIPIRHCHLMSWRHSTKEWCLHKRITVDLRFTHFQLKRGKNWNPPTVYLKRGDTTTCFLQTILIRFSSLFRKDQIEVSVYPTSIKKTLSIWSILLGSRLKFFNTK